MVQIAYLSLLLALLCASYAIVASIIALKTHTERWGKHAAGALLAIAGLLTLTVLFLLYFLLQRNFRLEYVANYTDLSLPTFYVVSALWAGQKGSLLFWGWVLSLCSALFIRNLYKYAATTDHHVSPPTKEHNTLLSGIPYISLAFAITIGFFVVVLVFRANPFEVLSFIPSDGSGMNPLLQNPYMVIHPPVLFIGYAGFVVPFALAFAALCTGTIDNAWIKSMRRWTLFSWYFLGMGIILGAHWAYLELGWGGYWAWDPVENASFIPWLTSTALLHTLILQQRKGLLKLWNIFLCIMTFSLCVFATFVTRSGIISSVHAFGKSAIGWYFIAFLTLIALSCAGLISFRWKHFRSRSEQHDIFTKENSFLFTTQLFIGLSFAVLYGTMYPLFSELFTGKKVVIQPIFFNRIATLVGLAILVLIGVCQRLPWKTVSPATLHNRFLIPAGIALVSSILLAIFGITSLPLLITCGFSVFVITAICIDIAEIAKLSPAGATNMKGTHSTQTSPISRLWARSQKGRLASHIFHLGVVLLFIGIAVSSTYKLEQEVKLRPGESATLGHIRFEYVKLNSYTDARKGVVFAEVVVYNDEQRIATLTPEKRIYGQPPNHQVTTEVGLHTSLKKDIYVILGNWDADQQATFQFIIHPMIIWIWIGGFLVVSIGIIIVILPRSKFN